jgi:heat shock protein HslJ
MSRPVLLVVVMTLVPVLAGCSSGGDPLAGTQWRLTGWTLSSLSPDDFTITAAFADGRISGRSAVNSYNGSYRAGSGKTFSVGQLAGTRMAGPASAMRAEGAYLTLLTQARSYELRGARLTLFDGGGNESLVFEVG